MKVQARSLGATVLSVMSSKVEFLIIGAKASQKKIAAATSHGAKILTEQEYNKQIKDSEE